MIQTPITSFVGEHFFLSNMFPAPVIYEGVKYPTSEHAYVAAKTTDQAIRDKILKLDSPYKAKRYGKTIVLRSDWDQVKVAEMTKILESKFSPFRSDVPLRAWLELTAPRQLIEGNTWGDIFWGQCPIGTGKNMLGKILMSIRDDITYKL